MVMMSSLKSQRGEGRIGCIISLVAVALVGAVSFKAVPVVYADSQLATECEEMAVKAGILPLETLQKQILAKAAELEIPEARAAGAIVVTKTPMNPETLSGMCKITIKYSRPIDFFGLYTYTLTEDKVINREYMDVR
jgi:hypothetical protein